MMAEGSRTTWYDDTADDAMEVEADDAAEMQRSREDGRGHLGREEKKNVHFNIKDQEGVTPFTAKYYVVPSTEYSHK